MKTERQTEYLYEEDPFLTSFSSVVESCTEGKNGWEIILNQTAFYPEGGGQPFDLGRLNGIDVLEVHKRNGRVVHICAEPLESGTAVKGKIDWARRFDFMQNHSGEHIVSGIAHRKWGCENVGFHMGSDTITIDFDRFLSAEQLCELEDAANRYIWEDHPVCITFPSPQQLEQLDYRSKKELTGSVRIVCFPEVDTCACCGTHIASSGQVGLVKLLSAQKFHQGVRIELVCGSRAMKYLNSTFEQNHRVSNLLSAKPLETGSAVQRLLDENTALKARVSAVENQYFAALVQQYSGIEDVLVFESGLSPDSLRRLCDMLMQNCSGQCACFSGQDGSGYQYAVGQKDGDIREWLKQMNQALHGRGGGKPTLAQGAVSSSKAEIEAFFAGHIAKMEDK